jgi:XTP/dITP diphosphohydrolase
MNLLIASTNSGKVREFREMLGAISGIRFTDLSSHPSLPPVEETGRTFRANACLKASEYATALGLWALADDSGLVVDHLGGKPGIHSARWAEMSNAGRGDSANNALLIRQLADVPDIHRSARFICVLALSDPQGRIILTTQGSIEGSILREPRGGGGFGYDPLFLVNGLGQTTGELPAAQKHEISHRGQALRRLVSLIQRIGTPIN